MVTCRMRRDVYFRLEIDNGERRIVHVVGPVIDLGNWDQTETATETETET